MATRSNYCGNHPHNYYIQLFAETGILVWHLDFDVLWHYVQFIVKKPNSECPMAYIYLFTINYFSIATDWKLFGQWGNFFIWFCISFVLKPKL